MKRNAQSSPERPPGARVAAALSMLAISLGVSTHATAKPGPGEAEQGQASGQHKVQSVQGKHRTSTQIKGETTTGAQTKVESVQGKHRASSQVKGEGATGTQVKIESQQHKMETPAEQPKD